MSFANFLEECRSGDPRAIDQFIGEFYPMVFSFIQKRLRSEHETEDLVQEIFIKIINQSIFKRFQGTSELELRAYVLRISMNHMLDFIHKKKTVGKNLSDLDINSEVHAELFAKNPDYIENIEKESIMKALEDAILALPHNYAQVIKLRLHGYTNKEISEILEKPLGTINSWANRALGNLRDELKKMNIKIENEGL